MNTKTVRELVGEIWAEINHSHWKNVDDLDVEQLRKFLDISAGVMARHIGTQLVNDEGFPVIPLPIKATEQQFSLKNKVKSTFGQAKASKPKLTKPK